MAATAKQRAALDLYAQLMEESKVRLSWIDMAVGGRTGLPGPAVRELCFLQLRMLCEVIALGCLTAHGDINPTTRLRNEYAADKIVGELEQLHPYFYPIACKQSKGGPVEYDAILMENGYLTKPHLSQLYRKKCGDALHRGSLKRLVSFNAPTEIHFHDITEWRDKIRTLLWYHIIFLFNKNQAVLYTLKNPEANNRVTWALLEAEQTSSFVDTLGVPEASGRANKKAAATRKAKRAQPG